MFDFEKPEIYKKAKVFNSGIRKFIKEANPDHTTNDQLRRASFSIVLNLAEGSGSFSKTERGEVRGQGVHTTRTHAERSL